MSKELEAFDRVWEDCSKLNLDYVSKHNLMDDLREIKKALTPPTADEVCEALSEQLKTQIKIGKNKHGITFNYAETGKKIISLNYDLIHINVQLPYNLITLIGRFYEAQQ